MKISVVIVHFNAQNLIEKAVMSLWNQQIDATWEFLITDNSQNLDSTFLQEESIPFQITDLKYNAGFARGVNRGLEKATGEYVLVINQDAYVENSFFVQKITKQIKFLDEKTILSCAIFDEEQNYQESIWLDNPGLTREWKFGAIYQKTHPNWKSNFENKKREIHKKTGYVPRVNGAFFMLKKSSYTKKINFDEDFFLYGEDVEWALRLKKNGWKFYYLSDLNIKHIGSASTPNLDLRTMQISITDWLVLKKRKGNFYLGLYFTLVYFNFFLNSLLLQFYKLRHGKFPDFLFSQHVEKYKTFTYLFRKYAFSIFSGKKLSSTNSFVLNCYQNDQKFISQIKQK